MTENQEYWDGGERRSIPIHILNYVNERIDTRFNEVKQLFVEHTQDEMDRYGAILTSIDNSRKASEERHHELLGQLTTLVHCQQHVESAFLKNERGEPDFSGHHYDHHQRKTFAAWWGNVKDNAITRIIEYGSIAVFAWLVFMIWKGLLAGPQQ